MTAVQTDVAIPLKPDPSVTKNITMQTETKLFELSGHLQFILTQAVNRARTRTRAYFALTDNCEVCVECTTQRL